MNIVQELKRFNEDAEVEDLVILQTHAVQYRQGFETNGLPTPEWLEDVNRRLTRTIRLKTQEGKELRLRELRAQQAGLMTTAEKRAAIEREAAALEAELTATK